MIPYEDQTRYMPASLQPRAPLIGANIKYLTPNYILYIRQEQLRLLLSSPYLL